MRERFDPRSTEHYQERLRHLGGAAAAEVAPNMTPPYHMNPEHLTQMDFDIVLRRPGDSTSQSGLITSAYRYVMNYARKQENGVIQKMGREFISRSAAKNMVDKLCSDDPSEVRSVRKDVRRGIGTKAIAEIQLLLDLTAEKQD